MLKKILTSSGLTMVLPMVAAAQSNLLSQPPTTDPIGLIGRLCSILGWVFVVLILLGIAFVIVAAFRYLTASGDPEKVKKANYTLLYAAIAIAVGIFAKAVPFIVVGLVGGSAPVYC